MKIDKEDLIKDINSIKLFKGQVAHFRITRVLEDAFKNIYGIELNNNNFFDPEIRECRIRQSIFNIVASNIDNPKVSVEHVLLKDVVDSLDIEQVTIDFETYINKGLNNM